MPYSPLDMVFQTGAGCAPLCETLIVRVMPPPETVIVPLREEVETFAAILKLKLPFPEPLVLLKPVIQFADDLTSQSMFEVTLIVPCVAEEPAEIEEDDTVNAAD